MSKAIKQTLTVQTPHGTFTRKTAAAYKYVAVANNMCPDWHWNGENEKAGNRPLLGSHAAGTIHSQTVAWSATRDGAIKNATQYGAVLVGVYAV